MDYTPNNTTPLLSPDTHHKVRWILILIACLVILVALVTLVKNVQDKGEKNVSPEEKLIDAMTAKGPSQVSELEAQAIIDASTAENKPKPLSPEQKKLLEAMTSKINE